MPSHVGSDPAGLTPAPTPATATLAGVAAIVLWSAMAVLTIAVPGIPPFQQAAMTFAVGAAVGLVWSAASGIAVSELRNVPPGSWALGVYGLLGYHVCYFFAFRNAPAVEVNLVNYLWPLLIVLFSGFLPARLGGTRLRWWHVLGALLGFGGTALVLLGPGSASPGLSGAAVGYLAALAAALIWSTYSVATRLYAAVPTAAVTGTCALTALGALIGHLALERAVWPATGVHWLILLAQGLGPIGIAFYLWDIGMKKGDIRLIGVLSYATPLLSTLLLAASGLGRATPLIWVAALLVTAGALMASRKAK